jgi:GT2 family glycosyltransferase/glycosyltransferase involved in cell wall biosynthesis
LTSPLHFIKKQLQDKLSISAKLSIRMLGAGINSSLAFVVELPARLTKRIGEIAEGRGLKTSNAYSIDSPTLTNDVADYATAHLLAKGRAELDDRKEIKSSIVIPVFNKAEFTLHCLHSLLKEIDLRETEVIVVENASTDDTPDMLSKFKDVIHVIRNEENRGFVDACNQGAAAARGAFLVFLNNDTEVLPGWLRSLEETVQDNPATGAVGSLLLYPDGSIQEAGAIIWNNGEAQHYGWSASPDDRQFNFAREVDYCSAASLLIRRELFEQLGGFDRRFAPAYYEDVDLCFGVRALGFKVIYQPASRVVHYEGVTAGRDVRTGIKHFQLTNRQHFVEKWRAVLERDHQKKNLKRLSQAARRLPGPIVLVFDERIPSPDRDAGSARMFMILKALAQWSHVVFVPLNRPQGIEYEEALWRAGIETADAVDYRRLLRRPNVQAAIVSRPSVAEAMIPRIRRANKRVAVVFDMVDAHFIRLQRESQISGDAKILREAERYEKLETRLARASDLIWCNSSADQAVMQTSAAGKRIEVIPTIHALHDRGKPFSERRDLLFVGNLAHKPNADAVHHFMAEIFPLITASLPDIKLFIVGDNATAEFHAHGSENVRVTGYLSDIEPLLHSCRVFIAPLRFGAGVKGKVGEAMSYALPVVTTSIGAEGFGLTDGLNAMIADTPKPFAMAVVRLYSDQDLWERVAENSWRVVAENFTPGKIAETINNSIKETVRPAPLAQRQQYLDT